MIGIFGEYNKSGNTNFSKLQIENDSSLLINQTVYGKVSLGRAVLKKYENDKVFFENEDYIVISDGILLNSDELKKKYQKETIAETLIEMFKKIGELFFKDIRGSYSCSIYDKKQDQLFIYTDQLADKKIFYSNFENQFIFSSKMKDLVVNENLRTSEIDNESCITLMTLGFMLDDRTLVKNVKKLEAGSYIKIEENEISIKSYFKFNNDEIYTESIETIISRMDELFRKAVKLQFDKDIEYHYKHIASLSGGLDSRMVNIVANDLGYEDILNYTFSQTGYMDATIAMDIASDLNHEFIFKSLDDANFLFEIDSVAKISFGSSIFYGIAHSYNCMEKLNLNNYGMVHTGQLGDVVIGSFNKNRVKELDFKNYAYSKRHTKKLDEIKIREYENDELFKLYNRGINFALNGNLAFQEFTESASPFCNVDFMQYCLNIPVELRKNHSLYYKWIMEKYPNAAKYKYESINAKITTPKIVIKSKNFTLKVVNKIFKILKLPNLYGYNSKNGMNPFDYWYHHNIKLNNFINSYYEKNKSLLETLDNEVSDMAVDLFENGIMVEKLQVLTLLSTLKLKGEDHE
ncbi:hypothetical protein [Carnobacterium divergens]|uniref:hypothetical protein n=1 Tax=Carnobacterium divergens TaxID=2748 RepID=UPI0039AED1DE